MQPQTTTHNVTQPFFQPQPNNTGPKRTLQKRPIWKGGGERSFGILTQQE